MSSLLAKAQVSHSIEYSSGTGSAGAGIRAMLPRQRLGASPWTPSPVLLSTTPGGAGEFEVNTRRFAGHAWFTAAMRAIEVCGQQVQDDHSCFSLLLCTMRRI